MLSRVGISAVVLSLALVQIVYAVTGEIESCSG